MNDGKPENVAYRRSFYLHVCFSDWFERMQLIALDVIESSLLYTLLLSRLQ